MPAKSKSQQRLFAMVHAYNKGEFHGSRSLRSRVADLSKHISDADARHFAKTPHSGLPERTEKKAGVHHPAFFSKDVFYRGAEPRVRWKPYEVLEAYGPRGNDPADVMIISESEALKQLLKGLAARRKKHPAYDHVSDEDRAELDKDYLKKTAQLMMRPENIQIMYNKLPIGEYAAALTERPKKRRSILGMALTGAAVGTVIGGVGSGAVGYGLATYAGREAGKSADAIRSAANEAGLRLGLWGAGRGALAGAVTGLGAGILGSLRS